MKNRRVFLYLSGLFLLLIASGVQRQTGQRLRNHELYHELSVVSDHWNKRQTVAEPKYACLLRDGIFQ